MARKLASIQTITALTPIDKADKIEVAHVQGWKCVVKKGDFNVGDKIIYFEIDSLLPMVSQFDFLKDKGTRKIEDGSEGYRLKIIRLRGQISEGLVMKPQEFGFNADVEDGFDLTESLGVKLWQPIIPACLRGKINTKNGNGGNFPMFIPKTDETRVQNLGRVLTRNKGLKCYVSEKVDGSSITCYLKDGVFGICSRNIEFDLTDCDNAYVQTVRKLMVEEKMRDYFGAGDGTYQNVALQGELCGTGIQGNRLNIEGRTIFWFNAFVIDDYKYASYKNFVEMINDMGLTTVPILDDQYILHDDIDLILKESQAISKINPKTQREGIVIRPVTETLDLEISKGMSNGRLSFKAINQEYLLANDDGNL